MDSLSEFFGKLQIPYYNELFTEKFTSKAMIFGIIISVLLIFAAFASKRGQVIGVFAGVSNFACALMVPKYIEAFHTMVFVKYVYGYSQAELDMKLAEYYKEQLPKILMLFAFSIVAILAFVFTLILCIKIMKGCCKICGIFALIITILRYVCISPISYLKPILSEAGVTFESQLSQLKIYFIAALIPAILLAISGLVALIKHEY